MPMPGRREGTVDGPLALILLGLGSFKCRCKATQMGRNLQLKLSALTT